MGGTDFRRKPQIFAANRRKPQNFAETRLSDFVCPFNSSLKFWGPGNQHVHPPSNFRRLDPPYLGLQLFSPKQYYQNTHTHNNVRIERLFIGDNALVGAIPDAVASMRALSAASLCSNRSHSEKNKGGSGKLRQGKTFSALTEPNRQKSHGKEGNCGLRNRSSKSQIASDFPSHP